MPGASRPPDGGIGEVHRPRLNPRVILTSSKEPAWGGLPGSPPGQVKPLGTLQGPPSRKAIRAEAHPRRLAGRGSRRGGEEDGE